MCGRKQPKYNVQIQGNIGDQYNDKYMTKPQRLNN